MPRIELIKPSNIQGYKEVDLFLESLRQSSISEWADAMRWYMREDLFFLVSRVLSCKNIRHSQTGQPVMEHEYYLELCRWTEHVFKVLGYGSCHDGRGMGKSTVCTFGATIWRMIWCPEGCGWIVSELRKAARKHFNRIMEELEKNRLLKELNEDVFYLDPREAAMKGETVWNKEEGLRNKRKGIRNENTLEFNSFFDGTPVGGHYEFGTYDDCESRKMIRGGPERINEACTIASEFTRTLKPIHVKQPVKLLVNTWWHKDGLARRQYQTNLDTDPKSVHAVPGEDLNRPGEGPEGGTPNYPFTVEELEKAHRDSTDREEYVLQICLDFDRGSPRKLNKEHVQFYNETPQVRSRGRYAHITIDPSRGVETPACILCWGTDWHGNYSLLDGYYGMTDAATPEFEDKLGLILTRANNFCARIVQIRVEEVGQSTWGAQIDNAVRNLGFGHLPVIACKGIKQPTKEFDSGKAVKQFDLIAGPLGKGRIWLPKPKSQGGPGLIRSDHEGRLFDLADHYLIWELGEWPNPKADAMMDCTALLFEPVKGEKGRMLDPIFPSTEPRNEIFHPTRRRGNATWMSA